MPFAVVRNDITQMRVDAIVASAKPSLLGGGGVDGAIRRAAGPRLALECLGLGGLKVGEAKRTRGYRLPCKYVIHTAAPRWQGGKRREAELLAACYRSALALAVESGCASVAFPLLASGANGFPKAEALRVATEAVAAFLEDHELTVYLVVFDRASFDAGTERFAEIRRYIDDVYAAARDDSALRGPENLPAQDFLGDLAAEAGSGPLAEEDDRSASWNVFEDFEAYPSADAVAGPPARDGAASGMRRRTEARSSAAPRRHREAEARSAAAAHPSRAWDDGESLEELLARLDESFVQMLFRKIDERGMTDVECYKRANIDRKLFSKIRSNPAYKPSKPTVVALAVALELPLDEARDMIGKAGFSLTHSSKFDIIVEYCIAHRVFNVFEINNVLFEYDMPLLGAF